MFQPFHIDNNICLPATVSEFHIHICFSAIALSWYSGSSSSLIHCTVHHDYCDRSFVRMPLFFCASFFKFVLDNFNEDVAVFKFYLCSSMMWRQSHEDYWDMLLIFCYMYAFANSSRCVSIKVVLDVAHFP